MICRRENDKPFGRVVKIIIGQTGNLFLARLQWHRFWAFVKEAVFLETNGLFRQIVAE